MTRKWGRPVQLQCRAILGLHLTHLERCAFLSIFVQVLDDGPGVGGSDEEIEGLFCPLYGDLENNDSDSASLAGISAPSKTLPELEQDRTLPSCPKKGTDSGRIPGDLPGEGTGAPWAPLLLRAAHHNCEQFGPCHLDAGRAGCRPGAPTWQARDPALAALPRQVFSGTGGLIFVDSGLAMAHLPTLCFALTHLTRARFRLELAQRPTTWWWWGGGADALPALWWAS